MRVSLVILMVGLLGGCGGRPDQAAIELRKEIQQLEGKLAASQAENQQLRSDVGRLESDVETLPTLPTERLAELWTVAGIKFGRLTGIDTSAEGRPLRVLLRPVDVDGHTLKAAGSVRIEAYDLDARDVRLGRWEFPAADIKRHWNSVGMIHEYVFTLPWDREPPEEAKLLLRATFVDALTGRSFEALREIR